MNDTQGLREYVISVEKGKFFRCVMSADRREYRKIREKEWQALSCGCVVYRWPGMYETVIDDKEELEKALVRYEIEVQELKKTEMAYRVEGKFAMRRWIVGDTKEGRRKLKKKEKKAAK